MIYDQWSLRALISFANLFTTFWYIRFFSCPPESGYLAGFLCECMSILIKWMSLRFSFLFLVRWFIIYLFNEIRHFQERSFRECNLFISSTGTFQESNVKSEWKWKSKIRISFLIDDFFVNFSDFWMWELIVAIIITINYLKYRILVDFIFVVLGSFDLIWQNSGKVNWYCP